MKNIICFLTIMVFTVSSYAQQDAIDKFFQSYKESDNFTSVFISPKMFRLIGNMGDDEIDADTKDVISNLTGLKILSSNEEAGDGMALYNEAKKMIDTREYEILMEVRDDDSLVDFLVKDSNNENTIDELLLMIGGKEFTLISFVGKIHLNKIGKLAESIEIDGIEHLDKLDDN